MYLGDAAGWVSLDQLELGLRVIAGADQLSANAIGTAWLRAGAQDNEAGRTMQRLLSQYAAVRTEAVTSLRTSHDDAQIPARTAALQHEIWTIASRIAQDAPTPISAQLLVSLNEVFDLAPNQSTYIPLGAKHRLENPGHIALELIEVQSGAYLGEDDIVRFDDVYGRQSETAEES